MMGTIDTLAAHYGKRVTMPTTALRSWPRSTAGRQNS